MVGPIHRTTAAWRRVLKPPIGWLKACASANIQLMSVTESVLKPPMGWSKLDAPDFHRTAAQPAVPGREAEAGVAAGGQTEGHVGALEMAGAPEFQNESRCRAKAPRRMNLPRRSVVGPLAGGGPALCERISHAYS